MKFEIENLEDIIKEAILNISPNCNSVELNEIYNRDIEVIWKLLEDYAGILKEEDLLYMPRQRLNEFIRIFYK